MQTAPEVTGEGAGEVREERRCGVYKVHTDRQVASDGGPSEEPANDGASGDSE